MCLVLILCTTTKLEKETLPALFAAFLHDMSRRHDGFCMMHGPRAAREKVPQFFSLFKKYGITEEDIKVIKTAISYHSQIIEVRKSHPHYKVTALLKDADALDRIRMGKGNLNPKLLRFPETYHLIDFSHNFYYESLKTTNKGFDNILKIAETLSGLQLVYR
jgi:hypothetical protein